jgi:hypothetical protein
VESSCEHGNELSGSIKCWEVLEAAQLVACQEGLSSVTECSIQNIVQIDTLEYFKSTIRP